MRIADRHGRPLSEVLSEYPAWELAYWRSWYSRVPSDGERVEIAVSQLHRSFISANSKKGHKPPDLSDLVLSDWYDDANQAKAIQADSDALTTAFRQAGVRVITKKPRSH